jgi:hypothetical protein
MNHILPDGSSRLFPAAWPFCTETVGGVAGLKKQRRREFSLGCFFGDGWMDGWHKISVFGSKSFHNGFYGKRALIKRRPADRFGLRLALAVVIQVQILLR